MKSPLARILLGEHFKNAWWFLFILIPNMVAALFEGVSFSLVMLAFAALNGESALDLHSFPLLKYIPFSSLLQQIPQQSLFLVLVFAAIAFQMIRSGLSFLGQYATLLLTLRIQNEAQMRIYHQILRFSFPCVSRYKVGDLVEYARAPAAAIPIVMDSLNKVLISFLMIVSLIVVMSLLSPSLTLATLSLFVLFIFSQRLIIRKITTASTHLAEELAELSKHTVQSLHGIRAIFTFNRQESVLSKTMQTLHKIIVATKKVNLWNYSITSINELIGMILVGSCLCMGAFLLQGEKTPLLPLLMTFITITYRLANRLQVAMGACGGVAASMGSLFRIQEILSDENKEFAVKGGIPFLGLKKEIVFEKVSLHYSGKQHAAVQDLSLTIPKGSMVALVGASGAGKSSLIDLLLKLYDPAAGSIYVDGTPLSGYDQTSWRNVLGVVSQDTFIFNETIEENIRFGDINATREQIQEAARSAGIHDFILHLPEGYATVVGERGYRLSGGERQRISLARALLRDPEILILDEATSNLDSHSEHLIQQALEKFQRKRTVIVIAHRLSTIIKADQIFVLDQGRLIEQGTHTGLLEKKGAYAHFWGLQSKISHVSIEVGVSS